MLPVAIGMRTILTRFCRLLIVIAIESWLFHGFLRFSPRKSVEYAATMNLLTEIIGIITFFIIQAVIPNFIEKDFIIYLMVGEIPQFSGTLLIITIVYFVLFLIIKVNGFGLYRFLCEIPRPALQDNVAKKGSSLFSITQETQKNIRAIVRAHTISYVCTLGLTLLQANEVSRYG